MKKNVIVAILCAVFAIGSSILLAYGVSKVVDGNHVQKDGNVLGISWYDEGGKEFVLSTAEELKEFARLSEYYDFAGQTVKLGADIVLNEGTAADFKDHAPANLWKPIVGFAGTFDGQGHTISGMYARSADSEMAMFIRPDYHCTVKDFSLKNSYFNTEGHSGVACVMANGGGAYSGIYSDAVMEHRGENVGGIGSMVNAKASFDECWFDGSISTTMRGVGGLIDCVGLTTVEVRHCLFSGDITMSYVPLHAIDLGGRTGGLVGYVMNGGTLTTEDCLVSGTLQTGNINHTGTLLGVLGGNGQATVTDTYVASDIFRYVLGAIGGSMKGLPVSIQRSNLIGAKGYEWTNLNFGKYWTVTAGQTPVLKRFSSGGLDVTGLEKAFDTSWYSPNKSEFELHTAKELYGLYYLSAQDSFENKTVTLGEDISLNSGNAAEWDENPPDQVWQPVGINIFPFKGTFDGGMHTVSGVYINSEGQFNGLFGATKDATVKNLKLKNSYIASTDQWVGSIVGRGNGTFTNIYSDATVVSSAAFEGGMVGQADYGPITMSGCWFDGKVINTYAEGENSRGFIGGLIGYVAGVDTVIEDSLFTGHLDISALNVKQRAGASGFIGVCVGTPQMRNILMMGTVNGSRMDGYYAHTGEGTPEGGTAYAVLTAPEEHYTDWQGNYGGRPSEQFDYKAISREAATGSIARFTMPELDWAGTWLAVSGAHPVLRVFADEATPSAEPFDVDWYSSEPYVLQDADDLYGFAKLVSNGVDFEGKTVTLGADITFNEGSAADWAAKAPENVWSPIGNKEAPFKGTFDGSMHTISGLYVNSQERYTGLFGCVDGATVKSLKLKNSYISSTEQWTGSIAGRGSGTFTELYSDAIVVCANAFEGGFIGQVDSGPVTMTDCWFNGTVTNVYAAGENSRGFVGGFIGYIAGVDVDVEGCLFTGHIDLSAMKVKQSAGAGGLLGVCDDGVVTLHNVLMLGSINGGENTGYFAYTGPGMSPEGGAAYAVLTAPNADCSDWQGNYGGYPTDKFTHRAVTRDAATGSIARLALPELDWTDTWQTVSSVHPVLRLFADEVTPGDEPVDVSWYDEKATSYVLTDRADLYGFAKLVNSGITFTGKTVALDNDITVNDGDAADWAAEAPEYVWTPIGNKEAPFKGTFDGQGHTISGLYAAGGERVGLFGLTIDAAIRGVKLTNSYLSSTGQWIGSFVGQGSGRLTNLYSDAIVTTSAAMVGGIVGANDDANRRDLHMESCWFAGSVTNTHSAGVNSGAFAGGLVGYFGVGANTLNNCLMTGTVDISGFVHSGGGNPKTGGLIGANSTTGSTTVTNSAYLGTFVPGPNAGKGGFYAIAGDKSQGNMNGSNIYAVVDYHYVGGGYGGVNGGYSISYTNLGSACPLGSAAKAAMPALDWETVWRTVDGKLPELTLASSGGEQPDPDPGDESADVSWYDENETSYVLTDRADLYGLAKLVNSGITFTGKTLTLNSDITFNEGSAADWATEAPEYVWTPIGRDGVPFKGTFDGGMHTISGLYAADTNRVGLFGVAEGATIRNVRLTNSYLSSTGQWIGSFAGKGSGTFANLYSDAIVTTSAAMAGGIVGANDAALNINLSMSNCWFAGSVINTHSAGVNSGAFTGGLVGYFGSGTNTVDNCLMTGTVDISGFVHSGGGNPKTGGLIGVNGTAGSTTVTNTAYLGIFVSGPNAGKGGFYAIAGDMKQGNLNGSDIYAIVDNHYVGGGYSSVNSGYSISYKNLGEKYPVGDAAKTAMPTLDWENTWQTEEGKLPALKMFAQ